MKKLFYLFLIIMLSTTSLYAAKEIVKVGVLALRGEENTYNKWNATALYLNQKIPQYDFRIVPIKFSKIDEAIVNKKIDFLLANSSIYVTMEYRYHIGRIATIQRKMANSEAVSIFGGVIFTRADNKSINDIDDLQNKTFAAVDKTSLGGWLMALRELKKNDFNPTTELKKLFFSGTHDQVVYDVLNHKADAGTVRTGVLESMAQEHKIKLDNIKVLHPKLCEGLHLLNSTACYPEWPMAKLKHTSDTLANEVAIALISMSPKDLAAKSASIYGWSIPHNYQSVHDLRKELKLPPYDITPVITFTKVFQKYKYILILAFLIFLISLTATTWILRLNRILKKEEKELQHNYNELKRMHKQLVESEKMASLGGLVAGVSHEINTPVGLALTGITHLLDEHKELVKKYDNEEMSEEDFTEFISLTEELGHSIELNLQRAANLVHSFKQVAVDQSSEELREFNIKEYVKEVLTSLHNRLKKTKHKIELDIDPQLNTYNYPGVLSQIITNLILNSLIHGYNEGDEGHIAISIKREDNNFIFKYSDDGKGISPENLDKIFEPFFTTNREHGGSGLGMNIIYNLVTQMLQGKITCNSEPGKGVTITIIVPEIIRKDGE